MKTFLVDLVQALTKELKYQSGMASVVLNTELREDFTANLPLCIIEIDGAPESAVLPGNSVTRLDWEFALRVYAFEPNAYVSDDSGTSASLLQIIDDIRVHFSNEVFSVQEMIDLRTNYGFRLTFNGITKSEDMNTNEGICMGYRIGFSSIAFDQATNASNDYLNSNQTTTGDVVFD